nr:MAG TPA: hypothetical protein [Caudoviricetes sp.]
MLIKHYCTICLTANTSSNFVEKPTKLKSLTLPPLN